MAASRASNAPQLCVVEDEPTRPVRVTRLREDRRGGRLSRRRLPPIPPRPTDEDLARTRAESVIADQAAQLVLAPVPPAPIELEPLPGGFTPPWMVRS